MAADHIMWAGRTLSGTDRFGVWTCEVPDGWWDSPDIKGEEVDRAQADGEYDLPIYNQARMLTFNGLLHAKSHLDMHEAGNFLTGPMRGRVQVSGHGSDMWADAKRRAGVRFTPITDTLAQWQVQLKCVNPRKYGERRAFDVAPGASAKAFHRGNYPASPIIQINGPVTAGLTITHPGGLYVVTGAIAAGGWARADFNTGRYRLNGNDRSDLVTRADLFQIPPGVPADGYGYTFSLSAGTGYVEVLDTYM